MESVEDIASVAARVAPEPLRTRKKIARGDAATIPGTDRSLDRDAATADDLSREVYCILGMPIDAIKMPVVLRRIEMAAANKTPLVISTPNLNFLVNSLSDTEFTESLLLSDMCPADGMPIVWIARFTGIPINSRIAGSDIFEALKARPSSERRLKTFLFGATEAVNTAAARNLNDKESGLNCVGWICPGFGTVDEFSREQFINKINASDADFLVAALGARKGQLWLQRNHRCLRVPIRAHLGATINFQAGTVKRAPYAMQKIGLEWLWRIKEERFLWRRYCHDGAVLLRLMLTHVLPLAIGARRLRSRCKRDEHDLVIKQSQSGDCVTVRLAGFAIAEHVSKATFCFREALAAKKLVMIDFSETRAIDSRFLGLLLMLRKQLRGRGASLKMAGISPRLARLFRRNGLAYLLSAGEGYDVGAAI